MSNKPTRWTPAVLLACAMPLAVLAAEPPHACASVANPVQRLACYDQAFPPPPGVREEAARQAMADFGLKDKDGPLLNPGQTIEEADPDRVQGKVASVGYVSTNRRSIRLEGGQVWVQTEATSSGNMQVGETVTLRKGLMGNYMLTTQGGANLRVRRSR